MASNIDPLATQIIKRNDLLKSKRSTWDSLWQDLADYIQPRKNQILTKTTNPDSSANADLYDTTAVDANLVLGAGQLQYITPASERWAGYEAPEHIKKQPGGVPSELSRWYQSCSDVVMRELARSNFYTEVHEFYLDRGGMGTCNLFLSQGKRSLFNCSSHPVGTYCIAEDDEGYVDTVFREFKLSVRQAEQKFGIDKLGPKVKKDYADESGKSLDKEYTFIHAVYPRSEADRQPGARSGPNKPVASVYVCVEDKHVVSNEGFDEMPYMVSRYLTWGEEVYGYCPSIDILATIRQVNFIEMNMDALAETAAFPRMLFPDSLAGQVDVRAGGVTVFNPNEPAAVPREWLTSGRYDIGQERVKTKQEAIKRAFHNDLFQMFAQQQQKMTAYETMQRVAEKLVLFSPTFARLTTEFLNPFLSRAFGIAYRAGMFEDPPAQARVTSPDGRESSIILPQVTYTSKVALAIKALQNQAFVEFMGIVGPLVNISPEVLDNLDADKLFLGIATNLSLNPDWLRDEKDRDAMRSARAQQQQAQAQIANAQALAKAGGDLGSAPPEIQDQAMAAFSQPLTPVAGAA
jgi:hypothetical protein